MAHGWHGKSGFYTDFKSTFNALNKKSVLICCICVIRGQLECLEK